MSDISVLGIFVADISFSGPKIPANWRNYIRK